jgi:hypothetical protein
MPDPLRFAIACVPLAAYLLVLGVLNARRRPLVTSGTSDLTALGLAVSGLAFIGPIEQFRPDAATGSLGNSIWLLLLAFYGLWVALVIMLQRPRVVVYNCTVDQLRPALSETIAALDPTARWAGDSVTLPGLGVQLHLDPFEFMRQVAIVSSGPEQNLEGWSKLQRAIARALRTTTMTPSPRSPGFFIVGGGLLLWSVLRLASGGEEVAAALNELLIYR